MDDFEKSFEIVETKLAGISTSDDEMTIEKPKPFNLDSDIELSTESKPRDYYEYPEVAAALGSSE